MEVITTPHPDAQFRRHAELVSSYLLVTGRAGGVNGIVSTAERSAAEDFAVFVGAPELDGLPWSIRVRGEAGPGVQRFAAEHGLTGRSSTPLMVKRLDVADPHPPESGTARIRAVTGEDSDVFGALLGEAFGLPEAAVRTLAGPLILDFPAMTGYLAEENGTPVGTALTVRSDDHVGLYHVSVPQAHRRRGHGRAVVAAALRDARATGARTAVLNSSDSAVPLYESMGFVHAGTWTTFFMPQP